MCYIMLRYDHDSDDESYWSRGQKRVNYSFIITKSHDVSNVVVISGVDETSCNPCGVGYCCGL